MEFNIDRADLIAAINKCQLATDAKHATESFRLMMVESKKKTVRFAAAGERASVATVAPSEIKSQGSFIVPPSRLLDIASVMPQGRVQISLKGERVTVKSLVSSRKATFQRHTGELRTVEDPGSGAPWKEVSSQELSRALRTVKQACVWDGRDEPTVSLLIPTERGLDVFGCNSYLVTLVETSLRIDGDPVQVPESAAAVLGLMTETDDKVRIFSDGMRTYLETCDTITSSLLAPEFGPQSYKFRGEFLARILGLIKSPDNIVGPTLSLSKLHQGLKSVLALSGFAGDSERGKAFGFQVHTVFGRDTVVIDMGLSEADARDEFDAISSGAELEFLLSTKFFDQMLTMLTGHDELQALHSEEGDMLILRAAGIVSGIQKQSQR